MNAHPHEDHDGLHERARRAGIALQYASFWGEHRDVPPEVLERVLSAMGSHADAGALPAPIVVEEGQAAEIEWHGAASWRLVTSEVEAEKTVCEGQGRSRGCRPRCARATTASWAPAHSKSASSSWRPRAAGHPSRCATGSAGGA